MSSFNDIKKTTTNTFTIKSPKLKGVIVENILALLYLKKESSFSDLLFEIKRRQPSLTSYKLLKKYLVYLADYELITYSGQKHEYQIEDNGIDLLNWISYEKRILMVDSEDITITIE